MKLSPILSRFLIENKKLGLPGIGTFYAEEATVSDPDNRKGSPAIEIRYKDEKVKVFSQELVDFVAKETGKMKVLAASDLASQLDDVIQYLNTGKIYLLQGIGSLITKPDNSGYYFEPETSLTAAKKKEPVVVEKAAIPQAYIDESPSSSKSKKQGIIIALLTLLAVAATVWFYLKKDNNDSGLTREETTSSVTPAIADTLKKEETKAPASATIGSTGFYRYILETTQQPRASKRFSQLKTFGWAVELETTDSVNYRIVMKLPAAGADTIKVKDSLSRLYGKKVSLAP